MGSELGLFYQSFVLVRVSDGANVTIIAAADEDRILSALVTVWPGIGK